MPEGEKQLSQRAASGECCIDLVVVGWLAGAFVRLLCVLLSLSQPSAGLFCDTRTVLPQCI